MRMMYIAPRFHTNQAAAIKGWLDRGDEVIFISYYTAMIEDYSDLKPVVLGFSFWYHVIDKIYVDILHRNTVNANGFKINHGFPPIFKLRKVIRGWKPDVIILRDRTLYTIAGYLLGRRKSKCILYNQSPLWDEPPKKDLAHRLVYKLTPKYRITPVMGKQSENKVITDRSYFLPFVVEPQMAPQQKTYFKGNRINLLCIGVFEPRKHHMMLMDVVKEISETVSDELHLTVIGEATERVQIDFLQTVKNHVKENHYEKMITIRTNIPKTQMGVYFEEADVFIIPSTREMASISQLEAMSYSLPAICSDSNGSACYIINDENGYQFRDCDREDLKSKLLMMLESREKIISMGENAYRSIVENNSFQKYYDGICRIISKYHE